MGLDFVELVLHAEKKYNIRFPDELYQVGTVGELSDFLGRCLQEQKGVDVEPKKMLDETIAMVAEKSSLWFKPDINADTKLTDILSM